MQSSRNTKIQNSICVVLVLLTGGIRLVRDYFPGRISNIIICVLFMLEYSIWGCQDTEKTASRGTKKVPYQCGSFSWISYFYPDSKICIYCGGDCDKQNALVYVLFPADF